MHCFTFYNSLQVQKDLKEIFEWVQTKESEIGEAKIYTTIEDLELSLPVISQIAEDSHNKLLFFDPLKLTPVSLYIFSFLWANVEIFISLVRKRCRCGVLNYIVNLAY